MRTSVLARGAAAAALALATLGGSAAVASAATITTTPHRAHTSLSIRSEKLRITSGRHDVITGALHADGKGLAGRDVVLERERGKETPAILAVKKTGPKGGVSFVVSPTYKSTYELVFVGTAKDRPTHSSRVTVAVKKA